MRKILCALLGLILTLPGFAACPSGQIEQTYVSATGTVTQNGTPTLNAPVYPTFYTQGNMTLRKVGDVADSYDVTTGIITRRVGEYVFTGNENIGSSYNVYGITGIPYDHDAYNNDGTSNYPGFCSHAKTYTNGGSMSGSARTFNKFFFFTNVDFVGFGSYETPSGITGVAGVKQWLADQYAAGTPVTVWYPLAEEITEYVGTEYCPPVKIATTAYNSARFSPVVTELNDTIATIRSVVTNTINQTAAIADLQATKQTRPDETCPAGKKCLLVEDDAGQPHWYEIIENAYGLPSGYTGLEYLQSDGASYLIVPYRVNNKTVFYCRYNEIRNGPEIANAVFGVTTSPDVSKANNGILRLTGSNYNRMGWGNYVEGSMINVNAPKEFNTWYEVLYDQNKLYQNDSLYATSATQTNVSWVAEYDLGVFVRNSASITFPAIAKISSVWAKENGEYKINLIPARRNSDSVLGMYDTVSGEFFTNAGSGTFTAGPEI